MTIDADPGALLDRARKYERQGRPEEAAKAFGEAAGRLAARGDRAAAAGVAARRARALAAAGRVDDALRVLAAAEEAAGPAGGELRAALDGHAAHVLAAAGRAGEAARRAWAAMAAFRTLGDDRRADVAGVHAARLIVEDAGPRAAVEPLRDLLGRLAPDGDGHRRVARLLADAERRPDRDFDVLVTDPNGAGWGALAAALGVGAHLAVGNGVAWNTLGEPGSRDDRVLLERDWGVTDAAGWREQVRALLDAENSDPGIQMVLDRRAPGMEPASWRAAIAGWCAERNVSEATTRNVIEMSGLVLRYEERFRADGLLGPDELVESVYGYDFGRAVNMARWGLGAGFCEADEAERCVLTAGRRAHQVYSSWESFSAGYVLGRMLRFDEGEFGQWYARSVVGHRILAEDPASPWRRMAWG
ncbi:DUF1266 domain-containing protein [Actinomadura sp. WAC 06369]|uniref:DUF1266 domain-containing protein n=1 Tax=Actinomadura sp. WAC 06369 TaxID=2203193 RepID=UPI000F790AFD|nr:DUF1266 domain-containing protein [Actinomadura sp. WAC 06369]RSN68688.1 hypothetical protein DMH08_10215 [Actinomadura sp. WAC 06369]